jgi:carboxylate-amine ligase
MADDALLLAALVRALVDTAAREWGDGEPPRSVRAELLRLASWRASRSGLDGDLIHPLTGRPEPAASVVRALLDHAGPALKENGDLEAAAELTGHLLCRGNGAALQREVHKETGDLAAVVRDAVTRTVES